MNRKNFLLANICFGTVNYSLSSCNSIMNPPILHVLLPLESSQSLIELSELLMEFLVIAGIREASLTTQKKLSV